MYTHCKAHNLNLSIIHTCKEPLVRNVMNTLQEIAFAFEYSAKRLKVFKDVLENDLEAKEQMKRRQKLKPLCETRWASRSEALYTFKSAFSVSHSTLGQLATELGDSKARAYQCSIEKFDFIVTLVTTEHVLSGLVGLSNLLQKKECDLLAAADESKVVTKQLQNERNDPDVWDALYDSAVDLAATIGVQQSMPRHGGAQQHRPNAPAPSAYWKYNMYLPFMDHLLVELDIRLPSAEPRFQAQYLIPKQAHLLTQEIAEGIYNIYQDDLPVEKNLRSDDGEHAGNEKRSTEPNDDVSDLTRRRVRSGKAKSTATYHDVGDHVGKEEDDGGGGNKDNNDDGDNDHVDNVEIDNDENCKSEDIPACASNESFMASFKAYEKNNYCVKGQEQLEGNYELFC
ncbi:uncharacterized protein LOC128549611 [Mercenaria mercenaria]|uniref:uncharacterized protein LOC128549611 n=1 Tax=Mercenaria mercenaria TaxID=6596 RepID=UPI00234EEE19|nr:uncharacterized protein LOC128549611 [Mercenaria mercenaria]